MTLDDPPESATGCNNGSGVQTMTDDDSGENDRFVLGNPGARSHVSGGPNLNPKWKIATALRSSAGPRGWFWRQRLQRLSAIFGITEEQGGIAAIVGRLGFTITETQSIAFA